MAVGQVIGRVSIKVLPDTSDFRRDAQRELDRIESRLEVEVAAKLDMSQFSRDLLSEIRKINQRNRIMDSRKVRIYTTIGRDGMNQEISRAVADYNRRAQSEKVKIRTELAVAELRAELDEDSLDDVEDQIDRWRRRHSPIKLEVQFDFAHARAAEISGRLALLTRPRRVNIIPTLDNGAVAAVATGLAALSGLRVLDDVFDGIWNFLKRIDQMTPMIGSLAAAIMGLSGAGLAGASNLAALSVSLAQIGPAALLLPGILGGLAIGIGTTVAAFKDFNTIFPDVEAKMGRLQNLISSNFWKGAEAPFRSLIDDVFPRLQKGLGGVSTQLGGYFGNLAKSLESILGPQLQSMFDGLSKSIDIFAEHTDSVVGIITKLGDVGASRLPQLAEYVGGLADKFDKFLGDAAADGRLDQWIDTALQNLRDLGNATKDFFGIFAGIGRAATDAGGSVLSGFANAMSNIRDVVDSPGFQEGLVNAFRGAHAMMDQIAKHSGPALTEFFSTFSSLINKIGPTLGATIGTAIAGIATALSSPAFSDGLVVMFQGLGEAVNALVPVMPLVGEALGGIARIVGALLPVLAKLLAAALVPLIGVFMQLLPTIEQIIPVLGAALLDVINALAPALPPIVEAFKKLLLAVLPLIPPLAQLIAAVLPPLVEGIAMVVTALIPLIEFIVKLINLLMPVLIPAFTFLAQVLVDTVMFAVNSVMLIFNGLRDVLQGVIDFVTGIFTGNWSQAWNGIVGILKGILEVVLGAIGVFLSVGLLGLFSKGLAALKGLWKAGWDGIVMLFKAVIGDIGSALKGFLLTLVESPRLAFTALKAVFKTGWEAINLAVRGAFDLMKQAVTKGIDNSVGLVKDMPRKCLDALGDLGSTLKDAGIKLIQGFIDGIGGMFGKVQGKLGDLTKKLTDWKGPESLDRVILFNAGQLVIGGFIKGLESQYDAVKKSLNGLTADVGNTAIQAPTLEGFSSTGRLAATVQGGTAGPTTQKVLNYYAAPGSSISSEEDLFAATSRPRAGW